MTGNILKVLGYISNADASSVYFNYINDVSHFTDDSQL